MFEQAPNDFVNFVNILDDDHTSSMLDNNLDTILSEVLNYEEEQLVVRNNSKNKATFVFNFNSGSNVNMYNSS